MAGKKHVGKNKAVVIAAFLADPAGEHYGFGLMKSLGMKSGVLYPILGGLTDDGLLKRSSRPSEIEGRPGRKVYKIAGKPAETEMRYMLLEAERRGVSWSF